MSTILPTEENDPKRRSSAEWRASVRSSLVIHEPKRRRSSSATRRITAFVSGTELDLSFDLEPVIKPRVHQVTQKFLDENSLEHDFLKHNEGLKYEPRFLRIAIAAFGAAIVLAGWPTGTTMFTMLPIFVVSLSCLVALRCSEEVKAHSEILYTVLTTFGVMLLAGEFAFSMNEASEKRDLCKSADNSTDDKHWIDKEGVVGTTGNYCKDLFSSHIQALYWRSCLIWVLMTWFLVTSCGIRFMHSLPIICLPAVLLYASSLFFWTLLDSDMTANEVFRISLTSFIPAIMMFLYTSYKIEWKARERFLFQRGQQALVQRQSNRLESQNKVIKQHKETISQLEQRYAPSTDQEKVFEPYRAKLAEIIQDHCLISLDFTFEEELGSGQFGTVSRALWLRKGFTVAVPVAIKAVHPWQLKKQTGIEKFLREVKMLDTLAHPRIIRFFGVIWDINTFPSIVLEFVEGGTLTKLLYENEDKSSVSKSSVVLTWADPLLRIAQDVSNALSYLHGDALVAHRDLKPDNVLLTKHFTGKLADLGETRQILEDGNEAKTRVGTPVYAAPEIFRGEKHDYKIDIYSIGIMLNEMETLNKPYKPKGSPVTRFSARKVEEGFRPEMSEECSEKLRKLIMLCWSHNPENRPSAIELCAYLKKHGAEFDTTTDDWKIYPGFSTFKNARSMKIKRITPDQA